MRGWAESNLAIIKELGRFQSNLAGRNLIFLNRGDTTQTGGEKKTSHTMVADTETALSSDNSLLKGNEKEA